jgi:hypothetical protein
MFFCSVCHGNGDTPLQRVKKSMMRKTVQKRRDSIPVKFTDEQKAYFHNTALPELWALKNKALERMELAVLPIASNG